MEELSRLGGPDWFRLGDLDLGLHLARGQMLAEGFSLTEATANLCDQLEIECQVLPMGDEPAPTMIETNDGTLSFQNWFVKQQWQPVVKAVRLPDDVKATPQVVGALERADIVVIAPSNPFVSIDPILNVYPIKEMVSDLPELVAAVSPIIAGDVVKGPAAKMMGEMDLEVASRTIASYYEELIDVFVYDHRDMKPIDLDDIFTLRIDTLMTSRSDRRRLAGEILNYTTELINQ
jgi:LPPG:FO 2-phospho-L-lactate transferase